jgi:OFA family oxalate/formate antiporter-like MFS transporter
MGSARRGRANGADMRQLSIGAQGSARLTANRWLQLAAGIAGMVMIANLQYGWTLFVNPIDAAHHWGKAAIQVAFSIFVLTETWLVPVEAYLVDRYGPAVMVAIGGVLVAGAWALNSVAASLTMLYVAAAVGGIGAGIVYGTAVGNALKWFPDRRGLAAGLTAAGFGAGSALTVVPIANMIQTRGYEATFWYFGIGQGAIVVLVALLLRAPKPGDVSEAARPKVAQNARDLTPGEMVRTPAFVLLYVMFTLVATGGLMAVAQLAPMAKDFKVADVPVSLFGFTMAALPFALSLDRVLNGLTRPFFGWVSDHIGRERTMFIAFLAEAVGITLLIMLASVPVLFVILSGLVFFAWGEIYSLFPAIAGDLFGRRYATTNYGLLYTAKGTASLLVPLGSWLKAATGTWMPIFLVAIVFDVTAAVLALFVLKPLCARVVALGSASAAAASAPTRSVSASR